MLINRDREKLLHAVAFFAENVDKCGKIKLFKLLYFLDFEHYKITGRSVTGMDYFAWQMGPVPVELYDEISSPQPDMAEILSFKEIPVYQGKSTMLKVETNKEFDSSYFTKRELKIMNWLATSYKKELADDMIEATHLENLPWHQVYNIEKNIRGKIPYELAFRKQEFEEMKRIAQDHLEVVQKLS